MRSSAGFSAARFFIERQISPLGVLQTVPAQQHLYLSRQPDALGLAHHLFPDQRAGHPHFFAGSRAARQAVGQNGKQHAIVPQAAARKKPISGIQLAAHAPQVPLIGIIIPDGQFREIRPHPPVHLAHVFCLPSVSTGALSNSVSIILFDLSFNGCFVKSFIKKRTGRCASGAFESITFSRNAWEP